MFCNICNMVDSEKVSVLTLCRELLVSKCLSSLSHYIFIIRDREDSFSLWIRVLHSKSCVHQSLYDVVSVLFKFETLVQILQLLSVGRCV